MTALFYVLTGVCFTVSVFLIARFGFFRKDRGDSLPAGED